jgi:hypothetical protein
MEKRKKSKTPSRKVWRGIRKHATSNSLLLPQNAQPFSFSPTTAHHPPQSTAPWVERKSERASVARTLTTRTLQTIALIDPNTHTLQVHLRAIPTTALNPIADRRRGEVFEFRLLAVGGCAVCAGAGGHCGFAAAVEGRVAVWEGGVVVVEGGVDGEAGGFFLD